MAEQDTDKLTTQQLHVLHVYQDPDFAADMQLLLENHRVAIGEAFILGDFEWLDKSLQPILKKWCLSVTDIGSYLAKPDDASFADWVAKEPRYLLNPLAYVDNDGINERVRYSSIVFDIDLVQKQDFLEIWDKISKLQRVRNKKQSRNKTPNEDDLIYAIFKQRQKTPPTTFQAIFNMYLSDTLPGYSGKPINKETSRDYTWLQKLYYDSKPQPSTRINPDIYEYSAWLHNHPISESKFAEVIDEYERKKRSL